MIDSAAQRNYYTTKSQQQFFQAHVHMICTYNTAAHPIPLYFHALVFFANLFQREDWTGPLELSDYERESLSKELTRRIKALRKVNKLTKVAMAIDILDEGRKRGAKDLGVYRAVLKVRSHREIGKSSKHERKRGVAVRLGVLQGLGLIFSDMWELHFTDRISYSSPAGNNNMNTPAPIIPVVR